MFRLVGMQDIGHEMEPLTLNNAGHVLWPSRQESVYYNYNPYRRYVSKVSITTKNPSDIRGALRRIWATSIGDFAAFHRTDKVFRLFHGADWDSVASPLPGSYSQVRDIQYSVANGHLALDCRQTIQILDPQYNRIGGQGYLTRRNLDEREALFTFSQNGLSLSVIEQWSNESFSVDTRPHDCSNMNELKELKVTLANSRRVVGIGCASDFTALFVVEGKNLLCINVESGELQWQLTNNDFPNFKQTSRPEKVVCFPDKPYGIVVWEPGNTCLELIQLDTARLLGFTKLADVPFCWDFLVSPDGSHCCAVHRDESRGSRLLSVYKTDIELDTPDEKITSTCEAVA